MSRIALATINARYMHASLGLRCLYANLGELEQYCQVTEFTLDERPVDIAERLLAEEPRIVGLGVYIWNAAISTQVVELIKRIRPQTIVVLGGPEVSYEHEEQDIVRAADYVVTGMADLAFASLCQRLLAGHPPDGKIISPGGLDLRDLHPPYDHYDHVDLSERLTYVEASRGCPFKCEFCLSALDRTAWAFPLDVFLDEMAKLLSRGARHFRFVDRTFNLKKASTIAILEFFLERMSDDLFLHFELIPDRLPDAVRELITRFPPGSLQFEIGVQTFTPEVQAVISRRQDNEETLRNLRWLRHDTHAHIHADLIFGLPGETLDSFRDSFDQLVAANPHEIQVGILKRLRGSPIVRHTQTHDLRFNPDPPYNILATDRIDFSTMQSMSRFARYFDLIINSGRFEAARPLLLGDAPFDNFLALSEWLFAATDRTHRIAPTRLFDLIRHGASERLDVPAGPLGCALDHDQARLRRAHERSRRRAVKPLTPHTTRQTRHQQAGRELSHEH